jgi:integrase
VVVLDGWNSWVFQAVQAYTDAIGLLPALYPDVRVFRGVKIVERDAARWAKTYASSGESISPRNIESAMAEYTAAYRGQMVGITCHDLRRTYAKLCQQAGMSWEALRANMGHSSVTITEAYVGYEVDWSERVPNWTIDL